MARPHKQTVEYFPHDTDASERKTLTIIQEKYGNDGFAFWFKLLQLLGKTPGHYYNFNDPADWEFLLAKTHQKDTENTKSILDTLVVLNAIDRELYNCGIIWCQNFVNRVADAYNRTINGAPMRPDFLVNAKGGVVNVSNGTISDNNNHNNQTEIPQRKRKGKGKEKKLNTYALFEAFWKSYPKKKSKGQAEKAFIKLSPDDKLLSVMLATIEKAKKSTNWVKDGGQYIPYPATWLNAKGWEDEYLEEELPKNDTTGKYDHMVKR